MTEFTFAAATLFEPEATPNEDLLDFLHDAPGMAKHLAKIEKFAVWLKTEMTKSGLATKGPFPDEGGWIIEAPSNGGFVTCIVTGPDGDNRRFHMLISEFQGAKSDVGEAMEAILLNSDQIADLQVKQ